VNGMTANKTKTIRQSMALVHTWAGVMLGSVLMVVFLMGSLSVFDREIDRWMMPSTRIGSGQEQGAGQRPLSVERQIAPAVAALAKDHRQPVAQWSAFLPDARNPTAEVSLRLQDGREIRRYVNPHTATPVAEVGTLGATSFFFPLHYSLQLSFAQLGYWIVGLAGMAMVWGLISGVVIHARIFQDFFTFRPAKQLQRSALDLHNLSGVLLLPFHLVITLSGLVVLFSIYFPAGMHALYPDDDTGFFNDALALYSRAPAPLPVPVPPTQEVAALLPTASLDAMLAMAGKTWGQGQASFVRVYYPGNANSYVEVSRSTVDRVSFDQQTIYFDGASGRILKYQPLQPAAAVQRYISGLHFAQFGHWPLRWLYFLAGLGACVMLGAGLIVWTEKRANKHAQNGHGGARVVAALACFSTTSLILATLAMLAANRLLPAALPQRALMEALIFFAVWLGGGLQAAVLLWHNGQHGRHGSNAAPWLSQTWGIALLAALTPLLNWLTTGDLPWRTLSRGDYAVFGVDAMLLCCAAIAVWAGLQLRDSRRRSTQVAGGRKGRGHG
jgi:uncharacterized iron-regulated membrane protein